MGGGGGVKMIWRSKFKRVSWNLTHLKRTFIPGLFEWRLIKCIWPYMLCKLKPLKALKKLDRCKRKNFAAFLIWRLLVLFSRDLFILYYPQTCWYFSPDPGQYKFIFTIMSKFLVPSFVVGNFYYYYMMKNGHWHSTRPFSFCPGWLSYLTIYNNFRSFSMKSQVVETR
jgi:hypothetical protein